MAKTVLITGTSSGIGKAAAIYFARNGWRVIAAQRSPEKETDLIAYQNIHLVRMDVCDPVQVKDVFRNLPGSYGPINAVVNNAGYAVDGVFEAMNDEVIRKQFETNVFGLMRVTREAIEVMRQQGGGIIIQISSMGGKVTFPLYSIYHSTKFAVEGFSESLQFELNQFKIKLKLIEPGKISTDFYNRSRQFIKPSHTTAYDELLRKINSDDSSTKSNGISPDEVAAIIFKSATDKSNKLRYPVGAPSPLLMRLRKLLPDFWLFTIIRKYYKI